MRYCGPLVAEETIPELREKGALQEKVEEMTPCAATTKWIAVFCGAKRYRRRKRYLFEEHTRWIQKGKAGVPVELGVPVCIIEDQYQFILDHKILWEGGDIAVSMIHDAQKKYPELRACSAGFTVPSTDSMKCSMPCRERGS